MSFTVALLRLQAILLIFLASPENLKLRYEIVLQPSQIMPNMPYIINREQEKESFSFDKVFQSIKSAGGSEKLAKKIALRVEKEVFPGTTTADIFRLAQEELKHNSPVAALKFCLKEAMRRLGPTGFQFEKFVSCLFEKAGYEVLLNQVVPGKYVSDYEIDFVAKSKNPQKTGELKIGECKYRNEPGAKVALEVALANYARFLDIKEGPFAQSREFQNCLVKTVLVTNTRFSLNAIKFSEGRGVELLGWKYPKGEGLEQLIDNYKLFPITILPSLNSALANVFAERNLMLVENVLEINPEELAKAANVERTLVDCLVKEAQTLLV